MSEFSLPGEGPEGAPDENHEGGESAAPVRYRITRQQLTEWGALYGTEHRQLRRWLNIGREKSDPPPFDTPGAMPAWWTRHMRHRVPDKILAAARQSQSAPIDPSLAPAAAPAPAQLAPAGESADAEEGEEVVFARQLVADCAARLKAAMRVDPSATPEQLSAARDEVTYWSRQYKEAMETFRKHKAEDREARKSRGILISRAEVECNLFGVIKDLVNMRVSMAKRVVAELKAAVVDIPDSLAGLISDAIERERSREDALFRDLKQLRAPDDDFRLAE